MLSYRLGTVNDFHWEFKPVFRRYSKPHTYSTCIGEEKENQLYINTLYLVHIKHEQKDKKVKKERTFEKKNAFFLNTLFAIVLLPMTCIRPETRERVLYIPMTSF